MGGGEALATVDGGGGFGVERGGGFADDARQEGIQPESPRYGLQQHLSLLCFYLFCGLIQNVAHYGLIKKMFRI